MEYGSIYHRSSGSDCYALDGERLEIKLRTGTDIDSVYILWADPFANDYTPQGPVWKPQRFEMPRCKRLKHNKIWSITVKPPHKRCKYYFEINSGDEQIFLLDSGFYTAEQLNSPDRLLQQFIFPWMNSSDIAKTPDWVSDTVWYQIFPDRFCCGDPSISPPDVKPWRCEKQVMEGYATMIKSYGGDLRGVIDRLPYLDEIGINGIYLNPIFYAETNHKYDTTDYKCIDPRFGDENTMIELVEKAHARGIRIMLDAVFNHSGVRFAPWEDVLKNGSDSRYYDWFMVNKWPFDPKDWRTDDGKFYSFAYFGGMPKLNTNNPEVTEYLTAISEHWVRDWKIDGIRFDVGNEISHSFVKKLHSRIKAINSEVYLLGEIWHDSLPFLCGDEYDAVMNYPFLNAVNEFWCDKKQSSQDFEYGINTCDVMYPEQFRRVRFNLLDSHDTPRLLHRAGSFDAFLQQLAVLMTMTGSPCIYYGTEIAMPGGQDPDCRRCMPWDEIESGVHDECISLVRGLIAARRRCAALRVGEIEFLHDSTVPRVIKYRCTDSDGNAATVIINCSQNPVSAENTGGDSVALFEYLCDGGRVLPNGILICAQRSALA